MHKRPTGSCIIDNEPPARAGLFEVRDADYKLTNNSTDNKLTNDSVDNESIGDANGDHNAEWPCNELFNEQPSDARPTAQVDVTISELIEERNLDEVRRSKPIVEHASGELSSNEFDKVDSLPYVIRSKVNVPSFEAHRRLFEQRIRESSRMMQDEQRMKRAPNKVARTKRGSSSNNDELVGLHKSANGDDGYCHCMMGFSGLSAREKNSQANRLENDSNHLNSSSRLNGDHRLEGIEESGKAKGRTVMKDDLISEPNDARRTVSDDLDERMASDNYRNYNGLKDSLIDKLTSVSRMLDKRTSNSNGPLGERLDENAKGGKRLTGDETGYCRLIGCSDDREPKDQKDGRRSNEFTSNCLRIDRRRLEDQKKSETDEKPALWSDGKLSYGAIRSGQLRVPLEPKENPKRADEASRRLTFASNRLDCNPKQTVRMLRNEMENNEETLKNKNTQTNAATRVDQSTQTEHGKRSRQGARNRLIPVPNCGGNLTSRMIDEVLVSRSQLW